MAVSKNKRKGGKKGKSVKSAAFKYTRAMLNQAWQQIFLADAQCMPKLEIEGMRYFNGIRPEYHQSLRDEIIYNGMGQKREWTFAICVFLLDGDKPGMATEFWTPGYPATANQLTEQLEFRLKRFTNAQNTKHIVGNGWIAADSTRDLEAEQKAFMNYFAQKGAWDSKYTRAVYLRKAFEQDPSCIQRFREEGRLTQDEIDNALWGKLPEPTKLKFS